MALEKESKTTGAFLLLLSLCILDKLIVSYNWLGFSSLFSQPNHWQLMHVTVNLHLTYNIFLFYHSLFQIHKSAFKIDFKIHPNSVQSTKFLGVPNTVSDDLFRHPQCFQCLILTKEHREMTSFYFLTWPKISRQNSYKSK